LNANNSLGVEIIGIGSYAPQKVLSNFDLEKIVDTSDEWIQKRTGIKERRVVSEGQNTSDLAYMASLNALKMANISPEEIDGIIVGTATPDYLFPSTACILQDKLGAANAFAFDLSAGCTGFIYSLSVAESFIKSSKCETCLVVGSELISRFLNWRDRTSCVLFGDGAGAFILKRGVKNSIKSIDIKSNGKYAPLLYMPAGGSSMPASEKTVSDNLHTVHLKGKEIFKIAVHSLSNSALSLLSKASMSINDIDMFIPHQANKRIIDAVAENLKISEDKIYINIQRYGNTSSASILLALDEAYQKGLIGKGSTILMTAFGAGLTWGGAIVEL